MAERNQSDDQTSCTMTLRVNGDSRRLLGRGRVLLDANEVRERMSGNLCRCGAYANIVPAILGAAR